ncbi:hypothetical protein E2C01_085127 [Portunus trituberculatus]|uniref:Uncharacterized protein n=1 Tax=Portunus trituberculatus TaxID=210409 RepID=A0A5B7JCQ3_PORTR|nr:hypothetical protein [Portunus trituberculatus]
MKAGQGGEKLGEAGRGINNVKYLGVKMAPKCLMVTACRNIMHKVFVTTTTTTTTIFLAFPPHSFLPSLSCFPRGCRVRVGTYNSNPGK